MGRTKPQKSGSKRSKAVIVDEPLPKPSSKQSPFSSSSTSKNITSQKTPSVSELYAKATELVEQCNYDLALRFIQRVLEIEPSHFEGRELLGIVRLEIGDIDGARQAFESLIPPSKFAYPNGGLPSAHLHLAQITVDDDPRKGLQHYQSAVDLLVGKLKGKGQNTANIGTGAASSEEEKEIRGTIASALVSMTEVWLTDLCMEAEAEQQCEALLQLALQIEPTNPEVLQCLASVRMSQQRPDEAKELVLKSWNVWKDLKPDDPQTPLLPTRLSLTRLFLELSLYKEALSTITSILLTDDQEVEAWYLEGWTFWLMAEDARSKGIEVEDLTWEELARDSRDCLETCKMLHQAQEHPDVQLLSHAQELIAQLSALGIQPRQPDEDDEVGDDAGDDWEDVDSEDEDIEME